MSKTAAYEPSVPPDHRITHLPEPDMQVRIQAFEVGKAVQTASLNTRKDNPEWAAVFDMIYYQLDKMFGQSE